MPPGALEMPQICRGRKKPLVNHWLWWEWVECREVFFLCTSRCQGLRSSEDRREGTPWLSASPWEASKPWSPDLVYWTPERLMIHGRELWSYQHIGFPLYYIITSEWGLQQPHSGIIKLPLAQTTCVECGLGGQKEPASPLSSSRECWSCLWKGSQKKAYF